MALAIAFAITDPAGGVAYYRGASPANLLRARGHTVVVSDAVQQTPLGRLVVALEVEESSGPVAWEPDVLVLTGGWVSAIELAWIEDARAEGQVIVADVDDWPMMTPDNFHYDPSLAAAKFAALALVDAVTVSTPYLATRIRDHVRVPVVVTPNVVDAEMYAATLMGNGAHALAATHRDVVNVGYRGGLAWHRDDVIALAGVLSDIANMPVRFVHVGHIARVTRNAVQLDGSHSMDVPTFAELAGVHDALVTRRPLTAYRDYPTMLGRIDIGIIPLASSPFAQAKSNIGGLELTAAGIPWVAGPNPEYFTLDAHAIATRRREWLRILRHLVREPEERLAWFARQRERARPWFAASPHAGAAWAELVAELAGLVKKATPADEAGADSPSHGALASGPNHDGNDTREVRQ